jgi:deoxyribonuclease IV
VTARRSLADRPLTTEEAPPGSEPVWNWPNGLRVGFHLSVAGGPEAFFRRLRARGATAAQFFLGSPRTWERRFWPGLDPEVFLAMKRQHGNPLLVVHIRYLANLASETTMVRDRAIELVRWEYQTAAAWGADLIVVHVGHHPNPQVGRPRMAEALNLALGDIAARHPLLLLETTAGGTNTLDETFAGVEEIRADLRFPTGICLDTCHVFQAGFDLRRATGRNGLLREARSVFGPAAVRLIHLNDSLPPFGQHRDRHQGIGQGTIGAKALAALLQAPSSQGLPVILETPGAGGDDPKADLENLEVLFAALKSSPKGSRRVAEAD